MNNGQYNSIKEKTYDKDVFLYQRMLSIYYGHSIKQKKNYNKNCKEMFASNKKETVKMSGIHNEESSLGEFNTHRKQRKQEKQI